MNRFLNSVTAIAVSFAVAFATTSTGAGQIPAPKTAIRSQSELPTHSYTLTTPTASALLDDDAAARSLARAVRADAEETLADYEITDRPTLRGLYAVISDADLLLGDTTAALANNARIRELGDKPAERLTFGLIADAAATAMAAGAYPQVREAAFTKAFAASVEALPWATVGDDLTKWKAWIEMPNKDAMVRSWVQSDIDPVLEQSGEIPADAARDLISSLVEIRRIEPFYAQATAVLAQYIAERKQAKVDIWSERTVVINADEEKLTPVVVAIWDEGVDTALFSGRLFTNAAERLDGMDDDRNGFIDDIHGIGYDEDGNAATESLIPFDAKYPNREAELRELARGSSDLGAGIDSATADAFRDRVASLKPEELASSIEALDFFHYYVHGTHVAGIAMEHNPAARLMVIRYNSASYKSKPPAPTTETMIRAAAQFGGIVDYMRAYGVRVVNLSWGADVGSYEASLATHGIGETAAERRKIAVEFFRILEDALTEAFRSAPEILFVPGAGNSNSDIGFSRFIPADIDLPNVLTAGAVDQAGDEASFTSYGERVRVYANGFQVESVVPGGSRMRLSGTSMAAPQVTNLAAKLFALDPTLTPAEVIELVLQGATKSADGKRMLINPIRSVALLETTH